MKVLTKRQIERVRRLAMAADALVSQAEAIVRNAHRSWRLRHEFRWAQNCMTAVANELKFAAGGTYYDPPRTRKVERMERMEREREERNMKRVTMGGSSTGQGSASQLPSGGCRAEEKKPKKVKE